MNNDTIRELPEEDWATIEKIIGSYPRITMDTDLLRVSLDRIYRESRHFKSLKLEGEIENYEKLLNHLEIVIEIYKKSPGLRGYTQGFFEGDFLEIIHHLHDAAEWIWSNQRATNFPYHFVIRKTLWAFLHQNQDFRIPKNAISNVVTKKKSLPYAICGVMIKTVFEQPPGDFSCMYEKVVRDMYTEKKMGHD